MGSSLYQYVAVFCANLGTIGYAISIGWMGIVFMLYNSDDCPLPSGPVKLNELAWVASILGIGGLAGTIAAGWMADFIGRKYSLLSMALPQIASYLLIIFAQNVNYLHASRFLTGFVGGAVFVVIPLMVGEIAEDSGTTAPFTEICPLFSCLRYSIRGTLSTVLVLAYSGGALIGFATGHFISYELGPWLCLLFPIAFFISYSFMPETPYYLMKHNRMQDAENSLRFYRNISPKGTAKAFKMFEHELSKLKHVHTEMQRINADPTAKSPLKITDFFNRPFAICCILMIANEACGVFTMVIYAGVIFSKSGSSLSLGMSSIIVAAIQLFGSYVACLLIERLGRKLLMVVSFAGTALCHIIMATYIYIDTSTDIDVKEYNWLPVVSFSAMIFIAACGALPIPYVILSEVLPDKIRNIGITFCSCLSWMVTFVFVKLFPALLPIIELWGCIYLFAICCIATMAYILVAVPETKGKSLEEILLILNVK